VPAVAPYGSWSSPLDAATVAAAGVRRSEPGFVAGALVWLESRPAQGGRGVLVARTPDGAVRDLTPEGFSVRTRVHEYGGGAWLADGDAVVFSNDDDGRLYRQQPGAEPFPITPEPAVPRALRYADGRPTPDGGSIVCVRERHDGAEVTNELVAVPAGGDGEPRVLASGADFYSFPRPSPEGRLVCWTQWDHPRMPWEGTELWVAPLLPGGGIGDGARVAGGERESIFQPAWDADGRLHFVSDRSGWWSLYRLSDAGEAEPLAEEEAEYGYPQWVFGLSSYAFLADGRIACIRAQHGADRLVLVDPATRAIEDAGLPYTSLGRSPAVVSDGEWVAFVGTTPEAGPAVVLYDPEGGDAERVSEAGDAQIDPAYVSVPRAIEFESAGGRRAHALFHPPASRDFAGPPGELPPLVVESHGGPTAHYKPELDLEVQYLTTRGIGVVQVNYGGSTGYGRAYRELLDGQWGIVDTEDCVAAARHLVATGEADPERLAIRGGSAGGYTTLCALVFEPEAFAAGASYYGVADAEAIATGTHKFEARYLDGLIGPYPERADLYRERSPIHFVDRLARPLLILQGLEDEVVPPAQAELIVASLEANGIPYAYLPFEGEQHGFRRAENVVRALEAELSFYGQVLGFDPAGVSQPVELRRPAP
jgi:dipeptidyl aminopeptidase/acylaminoacyl peptidase